MMEEVRINEDQFVKCMHREEFHASNKQVKTFAFPGGKCPIVMDGLSDGSSKSVLQRFVRQWQHEIYEEWGPIVTPSGAEQIKAQKDVHLKLHRKLKPVHDK